MMCTACPRVKMICSHLPERAIEFASKNSQNTFFSKIKKSIPKQPSKKVLSRSFLQWSEPTRKQLVFEACSGGGKRPKAKTKECNNKFKRFVTFQLHNNNKGTKSRSALIFPFVAVYHTYTSTVINEKSSHTILSCPRPWIVAIRSPRRLPTPQHPKMLSALRGAQLPAAQARLHPQHQLPPMSLLAPQHRPPLHPPQPQ